MKMQSYTQNLQCGALFWLRIMVYSLHTVKADQHLLAHKKQVSAISSWYGYQFWEETFAEVYMQMQCGCTNKQSYNWV